MNTDVIMLGSIGLLFVIAYVAIEVSKKMTAKKMQKRKHALEKEFQDHFGCAPATEKLLRNLQNNNIIKPELKRLALNFNESCKKEATLQNQIKHQPESLRYDAAVDFLNQARNNVYADKVIFYSVLNVVIELGFVAKNTTFKMCLNY